MYRFNCFHIVHEMASYLLCINSTQENQMFISDSFKKVMKAGGTCTKSFSNKDRKAKRKAMSPFERTSFYCVFGQTLMNILIFLSNNLNLLFAKLNL